MITSSASAMGSHMSKEKEALQSEKSQQSTQLQQSQQSAYRDREQAPLLSYLRARGSWRGNKHSRLRIGIMGGTFDPIHNGHLVAASEVAWNYDLDEVIFVPTGRPAFKLNKHVTNAEDRYLMTVIATSSNPRFTVSRVDIDRPGVTYTVDTLRDLYAKYPTAELLFITGADAVAEILRWKDADELFKLAKFVAVTRPGYSSDLSHLHLPEDRVDVLEIPALSISSTDVRARAARHEPVWYLVPDGVVQYIAKHGLYRDDGDLVADPSAPTAPDPSTGDVDVATTDRRRDDPIR